MYWDWFRLRHTVTGVATGAEFVEHDLRDEPFVGNVSRTNHELEDGRSQGRWTVVDLLPAALLAGAAVPLTNRRFSRTDAALPVALIGLVLGVRAWGLAAAALFPAVTPKLFVAVGYPVLVTGPPAIVAVLASDRPATRGALLAAVGLGAGIALDMTVVGVRHVPVRLAHHRVALAAALGVIALGFGREDQGLAAVGIAAWLLALAAPLLGVV